MLAALPPAPAEGLAAVTPTAGRAPAPAPPSGHGFAELLQRGQASHGVLARPADGSASPAESPTRSGTDHEADANSPAETTPVARPVVSRAGTKPMIRVREKAATATATAPRQTRTLSPDSTEHDSGAVPSPADGGGGSASTGAAPAVNAHDGIGALQPQGQTVADVAVAAPRPAGQAVADVAGAALYNPTSCASADASEPALAPTNALRKAAAGDDSPGLARASTASAERALPEGLAAQSAVLATDERHTAPRETAAVRASTPPMLVGAGGVVPRGFDPATPASVALPAPLYSPEFAQVLGAQVSVLARDGVQQAELHLNPAEMGPISVQIQLDGKDARVDFSANAAATREVIERGLPELASALREQGLTLAGGGVFQQAPDPRDKTGGEPTRRTARSRGRITAGAAAAPRAVSVAIPLGRLDLYA